MSWSRIIFTRKSILPALMACTIIASGHSNKQAAAKAETKTAPANNATLSRSVLPQGKKDERLEFETVIITPEGFEPQQLERTAGPFILSVTNQSGVDELNVRIETEQHGRFLEKTLPLLTPFWRERIDPPQGKYIITEENHPEWTLTLIIK